MTNTALGAGAEIAQEIIFISEAHEKFYYEKLKEKIGKAQEALKFLVLCTK